MTNKQKQVLAWVAIAAVGAAVSITLTIWLQQPYIGSFAAALVMGAMIGVPEAIGAKRRSRARMTRRWARLAG